MKRKTLIQLVGLVGLAFLMLLVAVWGSRAAELQEDTDYLPLLLNHVRRDEKMYIPAGEFQMGCDPAHNCGHSCFSNNLPLHAVYLDAFYMDTHEVTNDQYAQFLNRRDSNDCGGFECVDLLDDHGHITLQGGQYVVEAGYGDHPVIEVSWYGSVSYCAENSKRLPTESEWEKAARGTTVRGYPWGDGNLSCSLANGNYCVGDTSQVGSYPAGASEYGALDMAGNVWEWVNDWYDRNYYDVSPYANPPGPAAGTDKVQRGGGFRSYPWYLCVAYRDLSTPSYTSPSIGFRCASSAGQ